MAAKKLGTKYSIYKVQLNNNYFDARWRNNRDSKILENKCKIDFLQKL